MLRKNPMSKRSMFNLAGVILAAILVWLDQWTKALAVNNLKNQESIDIIPEVFQLHYLENRGAAFGMFQGQKWSFVVVTLLILVGVVYYYHKMPLEKRFHPLRFIGVALVAGAIGNLIDCLAYGYVVDFFYVELINFPVFNVADCYVTVSAFLLLFLILFVYKDEELDFMSFRKKKKEPED